MRNSCYAFALASLAPLLINCGGNDAVVLRQDALVVSPASISVSASAPFPNNIASFSVSDGPGISFTFNTGACQRIATRVPTIDRGYAVQAISPGACTFIITDSLGNVATLHVTVTQ